MNHNTWSHRAVRPLVRLLAASAVSPNHLTFLRLVTGTSAAVALGEGSEPWRQWAAGLFLLSMLLDRADGELARQSGKESGFGQRLDLFSDAFCNGIVFLGLGIGLKTGEYGDVAPIMGGVAGLSVALLIWLVALIQSKAGPRASELRVMSGSSLDDLGMMVPIILWLGYPDQLLAAIFLVAPALSAFVLFRYRHSLFSQGKSGSFEK